MLTFVQAVYRVDKLKRLSPVFVLDFFVDVRTGCVPPVLPQVVQTKKYQKEQDDIKHLKEFIASCGTYANLVRQAKSKQKILDKMEADGLTQPGGWQ